MISGDWSHDLRCPWEVTGAVTEDRRWGAGVGQCVGDGGSDVGSGREGDRVTTRRSLRVFSSS